MVTLGVELDHVEALATRLLPDKHVHVVRPVLVQRQRIRQRLARRLQRERHVHVTHRISVNKPNKTPHNSLQLRIESCFVKARELVRELVIGARFYNAVHQNLHSFKDFGGLMKHNIKDTEHT